MKTLPRWLALASIPALLTLRMAAAQAFTDSDAELKEAAAERTRVAAAGALAPTPRVAPPRMAWVPLSPKSLEGFRPVFADERVAEARRRSTLLAQASPAASAAR